MDNITFLETSKFKTNAISLIIPLELNEYTTDYNLLTGVLKRGCNKFKSTKEIWTYLQEMYGGAFDIFISKKGERLMMNFYFSFLDKQYTMNNEDLWKKAIDFLYEIIHETLSQNNKFNDEYFEQEKENLRILINSRIDDKDNYAIERAEELCTEGEPYSIYKYGNLERLNIIKNDLLFKFWEDIKKNIYMYAFIQGNFEKAQIIDELSRFPMLNNLKATTNNNSGYGLKELRVIQDSMKVNQGKLALCYRTNATLMNGDYFALAVMNSILGGGTHSKLFNEVREKHSLAYYSYSFIDKFKGLLTITSGVDTKNFEKAKEIIFQQIEAIKKGLVSEQEVTSAKRKLSNDLKNLQDSQYSIMDYLSALKIYNVTYSIADIIDNIEKVNIERIKKAAEILQLGSIYTIGQ